MRARSSLDQEAAARDAAVQAATRRATEVPFSVLARSQEVLNLAEAVVRSGNPSSVSDAGVAAIWRIPQPVRPGARDSRNRAHLGFDGAASGSTLLDEPRLAGMVEIGG